MAKTKIDTLLKNYQSDVDARQEIVDTFDRREKFLIGDVYDSVSQSTTRAQVVDQTLLSALIRRTNDTMAQPPTGIVKVLSKKNKGKGLLINAILNHYIIPNANTQYDIYTKFWMLEFLSLLYGKQDVLVDYIVKDDYVGPDFYLIPVRNGIPEAGAISIDDASRYWVRSWVNRDWLEKRKGLRNWKNIDKAIAKLAKGKKTSDTRKTSYIERKYQSNLQRTESIELVTLYERDRWVTFLPNEKYILREIENPHKNGELPIVSKVCYPLLGRYLGLSEYERLISQQKALNSFINLNLSSMAMAVYPPLKLYLPDLVVSTLKYEAAAKWILRNPNPNAITNHPPAPGSIAAFQEVYGTLKAGILSSMGTTDTTIPRNVSPTMGKTPEALKMQQMLMASHTNFDRKMLEKAIEKIYDKFVELVARKQEKPIKLDLFGEEIKEIAKIYPDVTEMFETQDGGRVKIKPQDVRGNKYKFFIDAGSTLRKEQAVENATLTSVLTLLFKIPTAIQQMSQGQQIVVGSKAIDVGELFKRWLMTARVDGWDKMIADNQAQTASAAPQKPPVNFEEPLAKGLPPDQQGLLQEIINGPGSTTRGI